MQPQPLPLPDTTPTATRNDLQLGRRLFHALNGSTTATAYALLFTHEQVVHLFGTIACVVYIADRIRIAYPELVERHAPAVNRLFVRAEERVRESAMIPYAIAVLLTILTVPKAPALIAIYTLALADPAAAIVGIRFGRVRLVRNRTREGSAAFFAVTTLVALLVLSYTTAAPWWLVGTAAGSIGITSAAFELLPLRIDDNLTIPLFVGFGAWAVTLLYGIPLG